MGTEIIIIKLYKKCLNRVGGVIVTVFLLVVSFIIDGVLLIGLFILNTRIKKTEELELRQQEIANDIEGMFSSYLMEIKEENQRLSELVHNNGSLKKTALVEAKQDHSSLNQKQSVEEQAYKPPEPEEDSYNYQPSVDSHIFELAEAGWSTEEIAKKFGKGKTEVGLLLKFHQKN